MICGCEAWTLTDRDEQYLRIFEGSILRKIFGPMQNEDGSWKIRMNYELNILIENADMVRFIKIKNIKQELRVKNIEKFNKTCSDLRM